MSLASAASGPFSSLGSHDVCFLFHSCDRALPGMQFPIHLKSWSVRVAPNYFDCESSKFGEIDWWACAVRRLTSGGRGEAESDRRIEFGQGIHLAVEPLQRIRPIPVCPADAGAKLAYPHLAQPAYS